MRPAFVVSALALSAASLACVVVRTPSDADPRPASRLHPRTGGRQAEDHAAIELRYFPKTVALLDRAESALEAKSYDDALADARNAMEASSKEMSATSYGVAESEAHTRLVAQARMIEGVALRGLGKDLDALIAIGKVRYEPDGCRIDLRERCREHAEWLAKTFPNLVRDASFVSLARVHSMPFAGDLSTHDMGQAELEMEGKHGYVGIEIEPTSSKTTKNGVTLKVEGKTTTGTYSDCNKVGSIRIEDRDYDVKRCHEQGYVAPRADFVATVSADDAAKLTGAKGERVFLIFDKKSWKHTGNVYTCGAARVAYVWSARKD